MPEEGFDGAAYLARYPDAAGLHPKVHYLDSGFAEGRRFQAGPPHAEFEKGSTADHPLAALLNRRGPNTVEPDQSFQQAPDTVDVIVPNFNRAGSLPAALASALEQTHRATTVWMVDDASTDGSVARVEAQFASAIRDKRLHVLRSEQRGGASVARNDALDRSTGSWVTYLDSDNELDADHVETLLKGVTGAKAGWAYGGWRDGDGTHTLPPAYDRRALLEGNYIDLNSVIHHRRLFQRMGGFDPSLRRLIDHDLFLRFGRVRAPARIESVTVTKRDRADSLTRTVDVAEPFRRLRQNHVAALSAFGLAPRHLIGTSGTLAEAREELERAGISVEIMSAGRFAARAADPAERPGLFVFGPEEALTRPKWRGRAVPFRLNVEASSSSKA